MANVIQTFPKGTGGGHTILDDSGAAVLDRKEMQFKGLSVTDNPTDEVTEVEAPGLSAESLADVTSGEITNFAITGGNVYSTSEQIVGRWIDGKPLYQKTISATSQPNIDTWGSGYEIGASVDTIVKVSGRLVLNNNAGTYVGNFTRPTAEYNDYITYIGTDNNHPSLPNRIGVRVGKTEYTSRPFTVTVQYTKTTDA